MKTTTLIKFSIAILLLFQTFNCTTDAIENDINLANSNQDLLLKTNVHTNTFYGPNIKVANGHMRSWIRIRSDNFPEEIGVEMTPGTLQGLPQDPEGLSLVLPLHQKAQHITPYDHLYINWNPFGHEPDGVFTVPHFDIHFEMTTVAEREMIPHWEPGVIDDMFNNYPPDGYIPSDYFTPPGAGTAEIAMGKHWIPINIGDYLPFSKIMIYGSYDGHVVFIEPMITLEVLQSQEAFTLPISQPTYFEQTSYYPTEYKSYVSNDGNRVVSLSNFIFQNGNPL